MKKRKESERFKIAKIAVTAAVVLVMAVVAFILPLRPTQSETEKRRLAEFPQFQVGALLDGSYFSGIATWFSDTVPFRDTLVSVNARLQHLIGTGTVLAGFNEGVMGDDIPDFVPAAPQETAAVTEDAAAETAPTTTEPPMTEPPTTEPPTTEPQTTEPEETEPFVPEKMQKLNSIVIYGNAGYEYYNFVQTTADNYAAAINRTAERLAGTATVYSMIIPTSTDIILDSRVRENISVSDQRTAIAYMESLLSTQVRRVSIFDTMLAHKNEYIYFRTDHHWTGLGAYNAYRDFCAVKGVAPVRLEDCVKRSFEGFLGSFYNDSGMNPALGSEPDTVETFVPAVNTSFSGVDNAGNAFSGNVIYNADTSRPAYKYSAFIWGDNPFSVIENLDKASGEACLLVKDSFGNAFAPLLCAHYKYVYIMDYRYYDSTIKDAVSRYGITDVIFANNISMTRDKNQVQILADHIG